MYVLRSFPFLYLSLNCIKNNWKLTSFVLLQVRGGKQRAELLVLVGGRRWEDGCIAHCKGFSVPHINISNDLAAFHSHVCVCVSVRACVRVCVWMPFKHTGLGHLNENAVTQRRRRRRKLHLSCNAARKCLWVCPQTPHPSTSPSLLLMFPSPFLFPSFWILLLLCGC